MKLKIVCLMLAIVGGVHGFLPLESTENLSARGAGGVCAIAGAVVGGAWSIGDYLSLKKQEQKLEAQIAGNEPSDKSFEELHRELKLARHQKSCVWRYLRPILIGAILGGSTGAVMQKLRLQRKAKEAEEAEEKRRADEEEAERKAAEAAARLVPDKEEERRQAATKIQSIARARGARKQFPELKRQAEGLEAERLEAARREAERLEAERLEAERLEAARREAERLEAARREAERLEAERLEAERLEAEGLEARKNKAVQLISASFKTFMKNKYEEPFNYGPFIVDVNDSEQIDPYTGREIPKAVRDAAKAVSELALPSGKNAFIYGCHYDSYPSNVLEPLGLHVVGEKSLSTVLISDKENFVVKYNQGITSVRCAFDAYKKIKRCVESGKGFVVHSRDGDKDSFEKAEGVPMITPVYLAPIKNTTPEDPIDGMHYALVSEKVTLSKMPSKNTLLNRFVSRAGKICDLHKKNVMKGEDGKVVYFDFNVNCFEHPIFGPLSHAKCPWTAICEAEKADLT